VNERFAGQRYHAGLFGCGLGAPDEMLLGSVRGDSLWTKLSPAAVGTGPLEASRLGGRLPMPSTTQPLFSQR